MVRRTCTSLRRDKFFHNPLLTSKLPFYSMVRRSKKKTWHSFGFLAPIFYLYGRNIPEKMKQTIIYYLQLSLLLAGLQSCTGKTTGASVDTKAGQGILVIEDSIKSFGSINKNETKLISTSFDLKNTGHKLIAIQEVVLSCGCLSYNMSSKIIKPNKTEKLVISINPKNQFGYLNKSAIIYSNAKNPPKIVRIKGEITK